MRAATYVTALSNCQLFMDGGAHACVLAVTIDYMVTTFNAVDAFTAI